MKDEGDGTTIRRPIRVTMVGGGSTDESPVETLLRTDERVECEVVREGM